MIKIDIVGGGAIGLLYGARLSLAGNHVTIWTRTAIQANQLSDEGIELVYAGRMDVADVESYPLAEGAAIVNETNREARAVFVTVKQTQITPSLLEQVGAIAGEGDVVIGLQNGVGHIEQLQQALPGRIVLTGVTTEGALRHGRRTVEHTGEGRLAFGDAGRIGMNRDDSPAQHKKTERHLRQKILLNALLKAGIEAELSNEMNIRVFQKLLVNAVINPLTALFGVRNGELPAHPARLSLMRALHGETKSILQAAGLPEEDDSWQRLLQVCERTSSNISSMLADIHAGRPTEIDSINGGVCRLAEAAGLSAPLNESVVRLVQALHY